MDPIGHPEARRMKRDILVYAYNKGIETDTAAVNLFIRALMRVCGNKSPIEVLNAWLNESNNPRTELEAIQSKMLLMWLSGGRLYAKGRDDGPAVTK